LPAFQRLTASARPFRHPAEELHHDPARSHDLLCASRIAGFIGRAV
jgi:hypothetical protein